MFLLSLWLCLTRDKFINQEEKKVFESKFNILFKELKETEFPLFYFIFIVRRFIIVIILNFSTIPTINLSISAILSLAVNSS